MLSAKRVLIVGGGPVGLSAALFLNKLGVNLRVIEKNTQLPEYSKALGINARTLELMNTVGATERILKEALKIRQVHIYYNEKLVTSNQLDQIKIPGNAYPFMALLPQSRTEAILRDLIKERNILFETGTALTDISSNMNKVIVKVSKGGETPVQEVYDYVFAADGAKSTVRKKLAIPFEGDTFKPEMYLSDYQILNPQIQPAGEVYIWNNYTLAIIPVTKNIIRLISNTEDYVSYVPSRIKLGKEIWKSNFRVNHRLAHVLQEGRTFLAGDAGHIHSPIGGRGMNIGIEDAFVFSKLLSTDRTEMYTDLRKPILEEMIKKINKATDVFLGKQNSMIKQSLPYLLPLFRFFAKKEITKFTLGLDHDIKV